jgi:hypothetical membrane protein
MFWTLWYVFQFDKQERSLIQDFGCVWHHYADVCFHMHILLAVFLSPQFSWTNMALSDLVVVGGATSVLFSTDLIISGLLTLAFGSGLFRLLQEKPPGKIGVFVFLLDVLALIAVGDFPENVKSMHYYASVAFFALIPLSMLLITGAFVLMGKVKRGLFTLLVAIFAASVWVVHFSLRPFHGLLFRKRFCVRSVNVFCNAGFQDAEGCFRCNRSTTGSLGL